MSCSSYRLLFLISRIFWLLKSVSFLLAIFHKFLFIYLTVYLFLLIHSARDRPKSSSSSYVPILMFGLFAIPALPALEDVMRNYMTYLGSDL